MDNENELSNPNKTYPAESIASNVNSPQNLTSSSVPEPEIGAQNVHKFRSKKLFLAIPFIIIVFLGFFAVVAFTKGLIFTTSSDSGEDYAITIGEKNTIGVASVDCGSDTSCFAKKGIACMPAKIQLNDEITTNGTDSNPGIAVVEIKESKGEECPMYVKQISLSKAQNLSKNQISYLNAIIGKDGTCTFKSVFEVGALAELWKSGTMYGALNDKNNNSFQNAKCEGILFNSPLIAK